MVQNVGSVDGSIVRVSTIQPVDALFSAPSDAKKVKACCVLLERRVTPSLDISLFRRRVVLFQLLPRTVEKGL